MGKVASLPPVFQAAAAGDGDGGVGVGANGRRGSGAGDGGGAGAGVWDIQRYDVSVRAYVKMGYRTVPAAAAGTSAGHTAGAAGGGV